MRSPESNPNEIRKKLEKMRKELPPEEYARQSARLLDKLNRIQPRRYALT